MLTHLEEDNLNFRVFCVRRESAPKRPALFNALYYRKEEIKEELLLEMSKYENLMGRKRENRAVGNVKIKELDPDMTM